MRKIKDFQLFDSEPAVMGNRIHPVNPFTEFKKQDIRQSIAARFESQVRKYPGKVAVTADRQALTYDALNDHANRVAREVSDKYHDEYRLSQEERIRYTRQMMLHDWGIESQEKLKGTTVFVAGAGGSGSPLIMQLALAGFGRIIICDHDEVELSNLNRQVLHDQSRIGMNKAMSAQMTIKRINPHVKVIAYPEKITRENIFRLVGESQIIFDNVDDMEAKFILSECALLKQIPHILSSMIDLNAYAVVLHPPESSCFHCLYDRGILKEIEAIKSQVTNYRPNPNPVASPSLFLSTGFAVNEAIKIILGFQDPSYNKYMLFNQRGTAEIVNTVGYRQLTYPFSPHFRKLCREQGFDWDRGWTGQPVETIEIQPDPNCPLCSKNREETAISLTLPLETRNVEKHQEAGTDQRIQTAALLFGQTVEMVVGLMGVLKAGKTYVPLDPTYPRQRLEYMLEDSEARIIVTDTAHMKLAVSLRDKVNKNINIIDINQTYNNQSKAGDNPGIPIDPDSLAYILYTSGSTGKPKGVMQTQPNVLHFARVYTNALHIHSEDRLTLFSSYSFDAAKMDIYGALLNGAGLYPIDIKKEGNLSRLVDWLQEERITIYHSIPTVYRYFTGMLSRGENFPHLRFIVLGGEAVFKNDVDRYQKYFPDNCLFINGLGPTESTVTLQYFIDKKTGITREAVPVGYPVEETEVYLINEKEENVRINEVGEIVYKSNYLALGYLNNRQGSDEVFVPDILTGNGRVYRSGDLGRRLEDGSIEYVGRKDLQVKIRGYRIEPGEIESKLDRLEGIEKSVVVCRQDDMGEYCLTAYYQVPTGTDINENHLVSQLKENLPDYMIPAAFYRVEEFPLTPTGKIDRKVLTENNLGQRLNRETYEAPRNEIEKKLVDTWSRVLEIEKEEISIENNFFELGGQSFKALSLAANIHKEFDVMIPIEKIFTLQTVRGMSDYIKQAKLEKYYSIAPVEKKEYYQQSSAQKRMFFLQKMNPDRIDYNIPYMILLEENIEPLDIKEALTKLFSRHEVLRTSFEMINGDPVQRVHPGVNLDFNTIEVNERELTGLIKNIRDSLIKPFDLTRPPCIHITLIRINEARCILFLDVHHIITDAHSKNVLLEEIVEMRDSKELLPLKLQYKDFSQWQNKSFHNEAMNEQKRFWEKSLSGYTTNLQLPLDYPRTGRINEHASSLKLKLTKLQTHHLISMARENNATPFMVVLSLIYILLSKISGEDDLIIGTPVLGRRHADLYKIVGLFVNTLPLRGKPTAEKEYLTFLQEAAESTFNALENQDFPFDDLVNLFHFNRDPKRNPLFDILYDFVEKKESSGNQKYPSAFAEKQNPFKSRDLFSLFDISFVCIKWHDILVLRVDYNSSLFKEETISRLILFFERIIESIIRNPKLKISQIEILQKEEQETLMKTMRDNLRLEFQDNIFMENNANAMNPEFEL